MFWAIYGIVVFASVAMMVREGLWSNSISLLNIIISGLVAFGFYAPLTIYLDEKLGGQYTYVLDFVVIWFLFAISMVIGRTVTVAASKTRMRFKNPIGPVGGPLVALLTAWVLAAFTLATLHTSPMPKDAFGGMLVGPADVSTASPFTSPDAAWLRFVQRMSAANALGSSRTEPFSAGGFVRIYEDHRSKYEKSPSVKVRRG